MTPYLDHVGRMSYSVSFHKRCLERYRLITFPLTDITREHTIFSTAIIGLPAVEAVRLVFQRPMIPPLFCIYDRQG